MVRIRNFQTEYQRRIARGLARGLTRSQARGHPGVGQPHAKPRFTPPRYNAKLERGLRSVREGKTLQQASKSAHVAPERLRNYMIQTGVAEKQGRRWTVGPDLRPRDILVFSRGRGEIITVAGYDQAAEIGLYMQTVKEAMDSGNQSLLDPFVGKAVRDVHGRRHPYETNLNVLYRLHEQGGPTFEQVYNIPT
jgi:hypothetical protein